MWLVGQSWGRSTTITGQHHKSQDVSAPAGSRVEANSRSRSLQLLSWTPHFSPLPPHLPTCTGQGLRSWGRGWGRGWVWHSKRPPALTSAPASSAPSAPCDQSISPAGASRRPVLHPGSLRPHPWDHTSPRLRPRHLHPPSQLQLRVERPSWDLPPEARVACAALWRLPARGSGVPGRGPAPRPRFGSMAQPGRHPHFCS